MVAVGQTSIARGVVCTSHDGVTWTMYDLNGICVPMRALWSAGFFGRVKRFYVVGTVLAAATDPNFGYSLVLEP